MINRGEEGKKHLQIRPGPRASAIHANTLSDRALIKGLDSGLLLVQRALAFLGSTAETLRHMRFNLDYKPMPEDLFIVTYPKSGTTWLQMILYQLMTDGSMEVPHLNVFAPYLDDILKGEVDPGPWIGAPARPASKVIKTHAAYSDAPKGCGRYIYVLRDGRDVAVSYYHHHRRNGYGKSFEEFFESFMRGDVRFGSWFAHVSGWTANPENLNVLFVRFEDLVSDLRISIERIAGFCSLPVRSTEWPRILHNCSFAFMRQHEAKLDIKTRRSFRLQADEDHFIWKGKTGEWRSHLDTPMADAYQLAFQKSFRGRTNILDPYVSTPAEAVAASAI